MDQFILFGDSITQQTYSQERGFNFAAALANDYIRKLDVVNRGFSGYNTRLALAVLPQIMPKPTDATVRFMTVFFGANDARLPHSPGGPEQHVPLEEYAANLRAILTHPSLAAHKNIKVILITPPPVDDRKITDALAKYLDPPIPAQRTANVTAKYAQAARDVGRELGLPVLDTWKVMIERAGGSNDERHLPGSANLPANEILRGFLHDGLHFTPEGYRVLYDELTALIAHTWPDQTPANLPFVLPAWDDETWDQQGIR